MARVYKKGQVTIPKAVREAAGIDIGDRVVVEARDQEIVVRRPHGVLEFEPPAARRGSTPRWSEARRAAREDRLTRQRGQDNS
jgi:AbrB family looped-hinge helix DNA binding protein